MTKATKKRDKLINDLINLGYELNPQIKAG